MGKEEDVQTRKVQRTSREEEVCRAKGSAREGPVQANPQAGRRRDNPGLVWKKECGTSGRSILETRPESSPGAPRRPGEKSPHKDLKESNKMQQGKKGEGGEARTKIGYGTKDLERLYWGEQDRRRRQNFCLKEHQGRQGGISSGGTSSGFLRGLQEPPPPGGEEWPPTNGRTSPFRVCCAPLE